MASASRWRWQRRARVRDEMPACKANSRFVIFDLYFPIVIFGDFLIYKYTKKKSEMQGVLKKIMKYGELNVSVFFDEGCLKVA